MARRRYQRAGRRDDAEGRAREREAYSAARKELRRAIRLDQIESWKKLCLLVDEDPWGLPYRVVMKKLGAKTRLPEGQELDIANALFPSRPEVTWSVGAAPAHPDLQAELFSMDELSLMASRLPGGKVPGPDYIPNEVVAELARARPAMLLDLFNKCLVMGIFPARWKVARLVLLHKGNNKPRAEPSSYRPLSLLDGVGKLFERLILCRLNAHLDANDSLSNLQFGFGRGRSTSDALRCVIEQAERAARGTARSRQLCAVVAIDVRNAFNSAPWLLIDAALQRRGFPGYLVRLLRSYMSGRSLLVDGGDGDLTRIDVSCGVPQGSVIGPCLWNIFFDDLLRLELHESEKLVGFADDIALVITAPNSGLLENIGNAALRSIDRWMQDNGLQVAPQKSEAVVLTNKWAYRDPVFTLGGQQISVKPSMRYLGVQLDKRLNFCDHIRLVTAAARRTVSALGRLMPNVQGPSACKRRLLMSVAHSKLLYASPVWALAAARAARNRVGLSQAQSSAAIRVARCYRTVSDMAALVLARMPPAHLLADERRRIEERKQEPTTVAVIRKQEREATLREWQVIWDHTEKAAWTRRMIPDIRRWVYQPNQEAITFHMAQTLTGHGCFQHYLWKRRRASDPHCMHCDEPDDTVEHTLFNCPFWAEDRREMEQCVGRPLQPNDVPDIILGPEQELLPNDASRRRRIEAIAEGLRPMIQNIKQINGKFGCPFCLNEGAKFYQLPIEQNLSIDEQMVPFKGKLASKQYMRGKPHPWGIKIFLKCGSSGIVYDFIMFQGSSTELDPVVQNLFGQGGALTDIFMLLGPLRVNRFAKPPLITDKCLSKMGLGTSYEVSGISEGQKIQPAKTKPRSVDSIPYEETIKDGLDHMPTFDYKPNSSRCKNRPCKFKTNVYCNKCNIHLCFVPGRECYRQKHRK
ncbi:hypothetical protein QTP88_013627 [Uroleucon formosanum]